MICCGENFKHCWPLISEPKNGETHRPEHKGNAKPLQTRITLVYKLYYFTRLYCKWVLPLYMDRSRKKYSQKIIIRKWKTQNSAFFPLHILPTHHSNQRKPELNLIWVINGVSLSLSHAWKELYLNGTGIFQNCTFSIFLCLYHHKYNYCSDCKSSILSYPQGMKP